MRKNDAFSYDVRDGEDIVITVTPFNFNDSNFSVSANLDGDTLEPEAGTENEPRFEFTVSKPVDDIHTVILEFNFIAGTPNDSRYDVEIKGEGGDDGGFTIRKTTANKEPAVEFVVVA